MSLLQPSTSRCSHNRSSSPTPQPARFTAFFPIAALAAFSLAPLAIGQTAHPTGNLDFGSVPVRSAVPAIYSVNFVVDSPGTFGTPLALTQGASLPDFVLASRNSSPCTGDHLAGDTCTVRVAFTPQFPGQRLGAVQLTSASGDPLATAYLTGVGLGPQVAFPNDTIAPVGIATTAPGGIAVDASGNVYIGTSTSLYKETPDATGVFTESLLASGYSGIQSVAVDGTGSIFHTDTANNRVWKQTLSHGVYTASQVGSGLTAPAAVALDGAGNVYIADASKRILKETLSAGQYIQSVLLTLPANPTGLAVDAFGSLYIADAANNAVYIETPTSNGSYLQSGIGFGLAAPTSLALDAVGNVYIVDSGNTRVLKETYNGSTFNQDSGSGLGSPQSVAVDSFGNVYIAVLSGPDGNVYRYDVHTAPAFAFADTASGTTSPDSPHNLTLQNVGNAGLVFSAPSGVGSLNPSVPLHFSYASFSTCPQIGSSSSSFVLAAGASCTETFSFAPTTSGLIGGSIVNTNNNLNLSGDTQNILVSGTGVGPTTLALHQTVSGASTTFSASLYPYNTPSGTTDASSITFYNGSTVLGTAPLSAGIANLTLANVPSGSSVNAVFNGIAGLASSTSNTVLTAGPLPVTATTLALLSSVANGQTTLTAALYPFTFADNSTNGESLNFVADGVSLGTATLASGRATLTVPTPAAGVFVKALYAGDPSFSASSSNAVQPGAPTQAATTIALVSSAYTAPVGSSNLVKAYLYPYPPTGESMTFVLNGVTSATAPIINGVATLNTSSFPAGTTNIQASYAGDPRYAPSSSNAIDQTFQ